MTKTYTAAEIRENRKTWAEELRSGCHNQCRGTMRTSRGHCCIGVAAQFVLGRVVEPSDQPIGTGRHMPHYDAVKAAMELTTLHEFIRANDTSLATFPEIADMVDALPDPEAK